MTRPSHSVLALVALVAACAPEYDAQLLVPEDIDLHWDMAFNAADDGLGAVVPVDVMVYDSQTGEPLVAVDVDVRSEAVLLLPEEVLPGEPEACADVSVCRVVWDAFRDRYYEVAEGAEAAEGLRLQTDEDGLARVYVFVDTFPDRSEWDDGADGFASLAVLVTLEGASDHFLLVPR